MNIHYGRGYVYSLRYHIVFCVKYRRKVLTDTIELHIKEMLLAIANERVFEIVTMEVMPDHVHLLIDCTPQHYLPDLIKIIKGNTARWLFMKHPELKKQLWGGHLWNPSYFVTTVSDVTEEVITNYINSQKERE
jgi:putative transposase